MKSVVPVVMAGILGIYGMIVAVIIVQKSKYSIIQFLLLTTQQMLHMLTWLQDYVVDLVLWQQV